LSNHVEKLTVLVDLDGTLAPLQSLEKIGPPFVGAKSFMEHLAQRYNIIIFSARARTPEGMAQIRQWLDYHDIPYNEVAPKPLGFLVDDRAVPCRPGDDPTAYYKAVQELAAMSEDWRRKDAELTREEANGIDKAHR